MGGNKGRTISYLLGMMQQHFGYKKQIKLEHWPLLCQDEILI